MSGLRPLLGALGLALLAGPVLALSCMRPDVAYTFSQLEAAEEFYMVVHGRLTFDEGGLPVTDWDNQEDTPPSTPLPARLTGRSLSSSGFVTPFDHDITLDVQCFGPWCASAASGTEILAFVELRGDGYVFTLDPCYFHGFADPTPDMLDQVQACMRGERCEPGL